jgi:hypothetical protein
MNIIDWSKVEQDEADWIIQWLNEDTTAYHRFLMWRSIAESVGINQANQIIDDAESTEEF